MKCYIDDKKVKIYPAFLKKLGEGKEGKVYKYKSDALKIYHIFPKKKVLSLQNCMYLNNFETKRILLPKKPLLDRNYKICGYLIDYIDEEQNIYDIKKEKLILELKELTKEIKYLSSNYLIISDWIISNFKYDGYMRFVDPGDYDFDWYACSKDNFNEVFEENYEHLINFIFRNLIYNKVNSINEILSNDIVENLRFKYFNNYDSIIDFINDEMEDDSTLNQYIKQIIKK